MSEEEAQHLGGIPISWDQLERALPEFDVDICLIIVELSDGSKIAQRGYCKETIRGTKLTYVTDLSDEDVVDPEVLRAMCYTLRLQRRILGRAIFARESKLP